MKKHALLYRPTEVIWPASISKLLVSLIVSLGIGLSSLVDSSLAEAGGLLISGSKKENKEDKQTKDDLMKKHDTIKTFSYKPKSKEAKIKLPEEYDGKKAEYNGKDGRMDGILKKEGGSWYWIEEDFSENKVLIKVGKADKIKIKRKPIKTLLPESVYEVTARDRFKQGEKINYRMKIYGNKGDKYTVMLKDKDKEIIFETSPRLIREDICLVGNSLQTLGKMKPGEYDIILAIGNQEKKQRIYIEAK